jgi:hypothetical protein
VALELVEWRTMHRLLGEGTAPGRHVPPPAPAPRRRPRWPARAAAAALLFVAGAACSRLLGPSAGPPPSDPGAAAEAPRAIDEGGLPVRLTFARPDGAGAEPVALPVYRPEEVQYPGQHPLARLGEPAAPWRDRLREAGLEIEAVQTWYVVQTDSDRVVVFPHYSARLRRVADRP